MTRLPSLHATTILMRFYLLHYLCQRWAYLYAGQSSGPGRRLTVSRTITIDILRFGAVLMLLAGPIYTAMAVGDAPTLVLTKTVDKKLAAPGDLLTYILTVTNTSTVTATNIVVQDQLGPGLTYGAASPVLGTFTVASGSPSGGTWSVAALAGGATTSLTVTATAATEGIVYNTAILGTDTVRACTSIPVHICQGTDYLYRLTVKAGRSTYQWYKNGVAIDGATTNVLDITAPGTYSLAADAVPEKCADYSCCPFVLIEDALPVSYAVIATPATCIDAVGVANGQLAISFPVGMTGSNGLTYQYSVAVSGQFNPAAAHLVPTATVALSGILVNDLPAVSTPVTYAIRVTNAAGCYRDALVTLAPTACICKPVSCVPLVIRKNSLTGRS